ncbi:MAG: discoidin domain-containing protein, partial [Bacteroidetes bacterium]|nr:discoidin domain-containing protein [Bacteroidota bacterium]
MNRSISLPYVLAAFMMLSLSLQAQQNILSLNSSPSLRWVLAPQEEIGNDSVAMFSDRYTTVKWTDAAVPGTVFGSFVAAGKEKDPNYADNIYRVERSNYDRNFWYRTEFTVPADFSRGRLWLNFLGVNKDADIFLNGRFLGTVQGIVQRGRFDISRFVAASSKNILAVLVHLPQYPISNGASPTYGSSGGWDWMPSVPGYNMGIQDDVFLSTTGNITIHDPWIRSDISASSSAVIAIRTELMNNSPVERSGVLTGTIQPGAISFSLPVTIGPNDTKIVTVDNDGFPELSIKDPKLWWPNGYGAPNMYTCSLKFTEGTNESDRQTVSFGIRKLVVDTTGNVMTIWVNGRKIFAKGGNWGMPEYMLRASDADYDLRVKLHKDMNFNIIRNWMGSTTDAAFYEACDRYGIMIWDDFWLNSSGGLPRDINVFNANAVEKIKRTRNHPSIVLWCGANEGEPLPPLDDWLRANVKTFDGRHYHANSHSNSLSGSGPWTPLEPSDYFSKAAPGNWGGTQGWGMRSEIGTAVFVNTESFRKFIPPEKLWPQNEMWDKHFFGNSAMYAGPERYSSFINNRYGIPSGIDDFCRKSQLLNIETGKAMFEGWLDNLWNDATGIIIWMSQPAYPSMVWQTYDYYYDQTGAYWGAKKACEPVHIQYNPDKHSVKVINTTLNRLTGVKAEAKIYTLDGKEIPGRRESNVMNVEPDTLAYCFTLAPPVDDIAFGKPIFASSVHVPSREPDKAVDGNDGTRWESNYDSQHWIYVDLLKKTSISKVRLHWESAFAKTYKVQVSTDKNSWSDIFYTAEGKPGIIDIPVASAEGQFVRVYCIEKGTSYGISLISMQVFGAAADSLSDVHFIKLTLSDKNGKMLSDNFYWRGTKHLDYRG